ncbi:MAG: amylo-alpha-1,6-glucosidase [Chloroflexota bacterium]
MSAELAPFPLLRCNLPAVERAYRIAVGDLLGNIQPFPVGQERLPVLLAGLDYDTPWTRDAAINVWNGLGLTHPPVARNTLLSVLEQSHGEVFIGGQYWDAMIWALGLWAYYLYTGDNQTLRLGYFAVRSSLRRFEEEEFDPHMGLFRGPAVYGDGVAAYPDRYSPGPTSSILDWVTYHPHKKAKRGYGIPMMALSTNCVYAQVYRILPYMAVELGLPPDPQDEAAAERLIESIQRHFWNSKSGLFDYLLDEEGRCEAQEGLGHAFVLLFDLASRNQARSVLENVQRTPWGIACVWPTFQRYAGRGGFGRHSGTIWPFINAFWAEAALKYSRFDLFTEEFQHLTTLFNRYAQCAEIYHPLTGEIYGGLQEAGKGESGWEWESCARQSWSASGYLRLILFGLLGMRFLPEGVRLAPFLPPGMNHLQIEGLPYRNARLTLRVAGSGERLTGCRINGNSADPFIEAGNGGEYLIEMELG